MSLHEYDIYIKTIIFRDELSKTIHENFQDQISNVSDLEFGVHQKLKI